MLSNAPLGLVGQMSARLTDQAQHFSLHVAVTGILGVIEDTAQNGADTFANSSESSGWGTWWLHALGYTALTIQPKTKLNDDASA